MTPVTVYDVGPMGATSCPDCGQPVYVAWDGDMNRVALEPDEDGPVAVLLDGNRLPWCRDAKGTQLAFSDVLYRLHAPRCGVVIPISRARSARRRAARPVPPARRTAGARLRQPFRPAAGRPEVDPAARRPAGAGRRAPAAAGRGTDGAAAARTGRGAPVMTDAEFLEAESRAAVDALVFRLKNRGDADLEVLAAEFIAALKGRGWRPTNARPLPDWHQRGQRSAPDAGKPGGAEYLEAKAQIAARASGKVVTGTVVTGQQAVGPAPGEAGAPP